MNIEIIYIKSFCMLTSTHASSHIFCKKTKRGYQRIQRCSIQKEQSC